MKREVDVSLLKDWRVATFASGCLIAGFLLGLLIFGEPWHLPPNWGDLPTWFLVVLGAVGGWAALYQLRILRQQFASELRRTAKRDELLDRQLAEAENRAAYQRRWQAQNVKVTRWQARAVHVNNDSPRPISDITCRIVSKADLRTAAQPIKISEISQGSRFYARTTQSSRYERLPPDRRCISTFDDAVTFGDEHIVVAWFTDDAGFRWQLDEYQHLAQSEDESEYRP